MSKKTKSANSANTKTKSGNSGPVQERSSEPAAQPSKSKPQYEATLTPTPVSEEDDRRVLNAMAEVDSETIIRSVAETKIELNKILESISDSLIGEVNKLSDLRKAQDAHRRLFEGDLEHEKQKKQDEWKKEQEEYVYQRNLDRRREEEAFKVQLAAKETELELVQQRIADERADFEKKCKETESKLKKREDDINLRETELNHLRDTAAKFPEKLNRAVTEARSIVKDELAFEHKIALENAGKAQKEEIQILENKVAELEAIIDEQKEHIQGLNDSIARAGVAVDRKRLPTKQWTEKKAVVFPRRR